MTCFVYQDFKFVLTADIKRMYRQIRINRDQTFLRNILWQQSPHELLKCTELRTVTYGTNCTPYVAKCVLNDIASKNTKFPLASGAPSSNTYMDDILRGCDEYDAGA